MRAKVCTVTLNDEEQTTLRQMLRAGSHEARTLTRARILLLAHEGKGDAEIVTAPGTSLSTVGRMRKQHAQAGLHAALSGAPRPGAMRTPDGTGEAYLVARACSDPPGGRREWTTRLSADRLVTVGIAGTIPDETVRRTSKRGASSRGSTSSGASPRRARRSCGAWRIC